MAKQETKQQTKPAAPDESQAMTVTTSGGSLVAYGEWSDEAMQKEAKEVGAGGEWLKIAVGRTVVRFLPPKQGWPSPFVIQHQHFIELPGSDRPVTFACPKMHEGKLCIVCAKADKLETSGNGRDAKMAQRLRPNKRIMANVVADPGNPEQPVQIWAFGKQVYDQLKSIRQDDENGGNFLDPMNGFNLSINRTGTGKNDTKYVVTAARAQSKLMNMDWIATQKDLRLYVRIPTEEQQRRLLDGEDPRDVWGDGDGFNPRDKKNKDVIDIDDDGRRTAEDDLFDDEVDLD